MCSLTTATHPSLPMTMMSSPLMSSAVKISPKICLSSFSNTPRSRYERAVFKLHENQSAFIYHPSDYLHAYTHTRNVCMYVGACMHSRMRAMSVCEPATSRRAQSSVTVSHLVAPRSLASTACLNPDQTLTLNPKPYTQWHRAAWGEWHLSRHQQRITNKLSGDFRASMWFRLRPQKRI